MATANKKYKNSAFSLYFSNKKRLIEVINAIKGTNYPKDTGIEINTCKKFFSKTRKTIFFYY